MSLLRKIIRPVFRFLAKHDAVHKLYMKIGRLIGIQEFSYATNLEDVLAQFYCNSHRGREKGFYVDVGALDPFRFSNTYALYLMGWHGINIEPRKDAIDSFKCYRQRDVNLNLGISPEAGEMEYFSFLEPAYNTTIRDRADYVIQQGYSKLLDQYAIKTLPLREIFDCNDIPTSGIDFLAIDVEGYELPVLHSNDWERYRPFFIAMESLLSRKNDYDIKKIEADPAVKFLLEQGYHIVAKSRNKLFFMDAKSK